MLLDKRRDRDVREPKVWFWQSRVFGTLSYWQVFFANACCTVCRGPEVLGSNSPVLLFSLRARKLTLQPSIGHMTIPNASPMKMEKLPLKWRETELCWPCNTPSHQKYVRENWSLNNVIKNIAKLYFVQVLLGIYMFIPGMGLYKQIMLTVNYGQFKGFLRVILIHLNFSLWVGLEPNPGKMLIPQFFACLHILSSLIPTDFTPDPTVSPKPSSGCSLPLLVQAFISCLIRIVLSGQPLLILANLLSQAYLPITFSLGHSLLWLWLHVCYTTAWKAFPFSSGQLLALRQGTVPTLSPVNPCLASPAPEVLSIT